MIYFIISIIINIFIIYSVYKKVMAKVHEPDKRHMAEINSLIVEFNKVTKNNIDLLEEKVDEVKNIIQVAQEKIREFKMNEALNRLPVKEEHVNDVKVAVPKNKTDIIKGLLKEGKDSKEIAAIMGISKAEVELYKNLSKK